VCTSPRLYVEENLKYVYVMVAHIENTLWRRAQSIQVFLYPQRATPPVESFVLYRTAFGDDPWRKNELLAFC
jgi:hypothetical protein